MGVYMQILMITGIVACLLSVAYAAQGTATFYDPPYVPSTCYGYKDFEDYVDAASNAIWKNGAACGKQFVVQCIRGTNLAPEPCSSVATIGVRIVDHCTRCRATVNLSRRAFVAIANPHAKKA
ncbi:EG45-like domain containing protein [Fagus crenata]